MEHQGPSSANFGLTDFEDARIISESIGFFGDKFRVNSAVQVISVFDFVLRAVYEDIFLGWVSVKIQKYFWLEVLCDFFYQIGLVKHLRFVKHSVQVSTSDSCSKITQNDSIHVYHWYYFELNFLSDVMSLWRAKVLDETLHHPTSLGLPWMQPANWKMVLFFGLLGKIGDRKDWNGDSSSWLVFIVDVDELFMFFLNFLEKVEHVGVRIWNGVGEINLFVFILKLIGKTQASQD